MERTGSTQQAKKRQKRSSNTTNDFDRFLEIEEEKEREKEIINIRPASVIRQQIIPNVQPPQRQIQTYTSTPIASSNYIQEYYKKNWTCNKISNDPHAPNFGYSADVHPGLKEGKSRIKGAGQGLFTTMYLPKSTCLGVYAGKRLTKKQVDEDYGVGENYLAEYVIHLGDSPVYIDGSINGNDLRLINDYHDSERPENSPNAEVLEKDGLIILTKDVFPGDEIYIDYGDTYFEEGFFSKNKK
jgi:hypothetical protein